MKILYATDGDVAAERALGLLKRAANPEKAQITVVSVVAREPDEKGGTELTSPAADAAASAAKQLEQARFEAEQRLLQGAAGARDSE